jgi:hypothetical protein
MSTLSAMSIYALSFLIAVFLLWRFSHTRWYWHVGALILAFAVGLWPPPAALRGPVFDVVVGAIFVFLIVWGLGEGVFRILHVRRHA